MEEKLRMLVPYLLVLVAVFYLLPLAVLHTGADLALMMVAMLRGNAAGRVGVRRGVRGAPRRCTAACADHGAVVCAQPGVVL